MRVSGAGLVAEGIDKVAEGGINVCVGSGGFVLTATRSSERFCAVGSSAAPLLDRGVEDRTSAPLPWHPSSESPISDKNIKRTAIRTGPKDKLISRTHKETLEKLEPTYIRHQGAVSSPCSQLSRSWACGALLRMRKSPPAPNIISE